MNCVNCGAPPRSGMKECVYCETALEVRDARANYTGYRRAVAAFDSDFFRAQAVEGLRGKFTAGQVRAILAEFDSDFFREQAAEELVPRTLNPGALLDCAELFDSDFSRAQFMQMLSTDVDETWNDGEYREEAPRRRPAPRDRPTPPATQSAAVRGPSWGWILLVGGVLAVVLKTC